VLLLLQGTLVVPFLQFLNSVPAHNALLLRRRCVVVGSKSFYLNQIILAMWAGSSVGIAIDYGLDGPGSNLGGARDFPPVQTGPGAHSASCKMGTGSFSG